MAQVRELRNRTPQPASAPEPGHLELEIGGMTCAHCPPLLEKALKSVDGVRAARVNLSAQRASVDYDPGQTSAHEILETIRGAGYTAGTAKVRVGIKGMTCSSCVSQIEHALKATPGAVSCSVSLGSEAADVVYLPERVDRARHRPRHRGEWLPAGRTDGRHRGSAGRPGGRAGTRVPHLDAQVLVRGDCLDPGDGPELPRPDPRTSRLDANGKRRAAGRMGSFSASSLSRCCCGRARSSTSACGRP